MIGQENISQTAAHPATRRRALARMAIALGGMAAGSAVRAQTEQPHTKEMPGSSANQARTSLHQETGFKAGPERIYEILLDSRQFAAFTGVPATIHPKAGGEFSMFGGMIVGLNVELVPNQRIVQAWRPKHWEPGVYSIVKFELKPQGSGTLVVLDHTGFPEGDFDHLNPGWRMRYWEPLTKYLAKG